MSKRKPDWADKAAKALDKKLWGNGDSHPQEHVDAVTAKALRAAMLFGDKVGYERGFEAGKRKFSRNIERRNPT